MMGDNLASLFPNTNISFAGINLGSHQIFAITATLIILPTVWLRNLSLLSYLSGFLSFLLLSYIYIYIYIYIYFFFFNLHISLWLLILKLFVQVEE
jgi:vesicular inhibitory amino acid transporter